MTIDPTLNIGTLIHGAVTLVMIGAAWGSIRRELEEIKRRIGCTEEDVDAQGNQTNTIASRLTSLEKDVEWLKSVDKHRQR